MKEEMPNYPAEPKQHSVTQLAAIEWVEQRSPGGDHEPNDKLVFFESRAVDAPTAIHLSLKPSNLLTCQPLRAAAFASVETNRSFAPSDSKKNRTKIPAD